MNNFPGIREGNSFVVFVFVIALSPYYAVYAFSTLYLRGKEVHSIYVYARACASVCRLTCATRPLLSRLTHTRAYYTHRTVRASLGYSATPNTGYDDTRAHLARRTLEMSPLPPCRAPPSLPIYLPSLSSLFAFLARFENAERTHGVFPPLPSSLLSPLPTPLSPEKAYPTRSGFPSQRPTVRRRSAIYSRSSGDGRARRGRRSASHLLESRRRARRDVCSSGAVPRGFSRARVCFVHHYSCLCVPPPRFRLRYTLVYRVPRARVRYARFLFPSGICLAPHDYSANAREDNATTTTTVVRRVVARVSS